MEWTLKCPGFIVRLYQMPNLPYGPCCVCSTHSSTFAPALTEISKVMLLGTDSLSLSQLLGGWFHLKKCLEPEKDGTSALVVCSTALLGINLISLITN